jgi:SAM-dependent methyltransferase
MIDPKAFDAFAADYDGAFTNTRLGRMLRDRVQAIFARHFQPGDYVLELTCGTGEDAVWLAQRGIFVTATDSSAGMVALTAQKAAQAYVEEQINVAQLSLQQLANQPQQVVKQTAFAGVFSNFGGLNTIGNWRPLAASLAQITQPGATVILVAMGPYCPWELFWHLIHGEWKTAVRRFKKNAPATIGGSVIPIWYPSARRLRHDFSPWFSHMQTESLGLWLPPSYLGHLVDRWTCLFVLLNQLEQKTARLTGGLGDHYVLLLKRK